ncbi:TPA: hypothetical protein RG697_001321 [Morganella morganii]|uniref:hypothetical protein n=1 Tax=Morganella morganii TaxID=582 RepID=UPI001BD988A9|nr:hypothetical protein [Morganella morganii]MBT0380760.1 hypothetical protein [Morganella morganii subsp. morganii]HDU8609732.1 hypothetical protein [Morganella morganii]
MNKDVIVIINNKISIHPVDIKDSIVVIKDGESTQSLRIFEYEDDKVSGVYHYIAPECTEMYHNEVFDRIREAKGRPDYTPTTNKR